MRASRLVYLVLLAACGDDAAPAAEGERTWPVDGFLRLLPDTVSVTMRLPTAAALAADPESHRAFVHALGRDDPGPGVLFHAAARPDGMDPSVGPGLAIGPKGHWIHYLPAKDKAQLNRTLQGLAGKVSFREEEGWVILFRGGEGPGNKEGDPLPAGDLALRVHHHPLLSLLAYPGDTLELAFRLGGGGVDFSGRLVPAALSLLNRHLEEARPGPGDLLDFIPSGLALRVETTLPATMLARFLTRQVAAHCGFVEDGHRVIFERLLREALTAVDPDTGLALGVDFHQGATSFVMLGKIAKGPPSRILAQLSKGAEHGLAIIEPREAKGAGRNLKVWIAEAKPKLDGLPESLWGVVGDLCDQDAGLQLNASTRGGWFIVAAGRRADLLGRNVRARLAAGTTRSPGSSALRAARDRARGDYVFGVVVAGAGLEGMADADRTALAGLLGATADARAPRALAVAGTRHEGALLLEGRALYATDGTRGAR